VQGLVLTKSISDNIVLPVLHRFARFRLLRMGRGRAMAADMIEKLSIRSRGGRQVIGELSGGNQQKVVLAKALATDAELLLLDEPTFGVDIGAAAELIKHVRAMMRASKGALWATSDLQELLEVSDRILILTDDGIGTEVLRGDENFNEAFLIQAMQRRLHRAAPAGGVTP
jgi:ABC-type sugar transport system ATPase subunit